MARTKSLETNTPEDQPIQIEVGDEEEVKTPEPVAEPEAEVRTEAPEPEPTPKEEDPAVLRKRLEEQIRAEVLADEARKAAALRAEYDQKLAAERQRSTEFEARARQSDTDSLTNALGAAQAEADAAKKDYRAAIATGDIDLQTESHERWIEAVARKQWLEEAKNEFEAQVEQQQQPQQRQPTQQEVLEHQIRNMAEPAKAWFRQRPEYALDPQKSQAVIAAHHRAIGAGHAELSPGYFEYVETSLGLRSRTEPRKERTTVVAAPVTREAPSTTGQRAPTKIDLSPEEREMAYATRPRENMTRQEAEKLYAQNKLRLVTAKRNGEIQ